MMDRNSCTETPNCCWISAHCGEYLLSDIMKIKIRDLNLLLFTVAYSRTLTCSLPLSSESNELSVRPLCE